MDAIIPPDLVPSPPWQAVTALVRDMCSNPGKSLIWQLEALRRSGAQIAVLPRRYGGLGFGTEPEGADGIFELLRLIGQGDLSLGRVFEGHVNALRLVFRYGNDAQAAEAARDVRDGHLFAIWNTEMPPGVRSQGASALTGRKSHCSAAGIATRGLITVDQYDQGGRLLVVKLAAGERAGALPGMLHGMRATQSGWIDFDGYPVSNSDWIGQPGDYLREPVFSAGAWRAYAVILGGLDALVEQTRWQLRERRRDENPHQRARFAECLMARETARLWVRECARLADGGDYSGDGIAEYVNLARGAIEAACFATIRLTQQSIGLQAFLDSNPIEQLMRDLATYLRQPAMDEGLMDAAAWFMTHPSSAFGPVPE